MLFLVLFSSNDPGGGGGGVTHHTTCYAPRVQKKRRKGSVFRYTASKGVLDVSPEKGVFFSSLSPFRGPISQSRFRGVLTPFDILVVGIIWKIDHQ